jgi:hypothetical protein
LFESFLIQNGLKQDDLSPLIFNFAIEYSTIRKVWGNQVGLKLNGAHLLLAYTDVNLLGDNTDTIKKNKETLIDASREVD